MRNKWLRFGLILVGTVLALAIVFGAGIFVGRMGGRANVLHPIRWFTILFSGAHGAVGRVEKIDGQTLTLELRDGSPQTVLLDSQTRIEKNRQRINAGDLHTNDQVQVIGSPGDQGSIRARWVRVMIQPEANQGNPTESK